MFLASLFEKKTKIPAPQDALKGRDMRRFPPPRAISSTARR